MQGQIVALATVVIPPENTPEKKSSEYLTAHPRWKYVGPADTIRLEWQIGRMDTFFNGITARKYSTRSQPAAMVLTEFSTSLPAISLSALSPGYYDCEIWFKDKFSDLRVIVENCVKIVEVAPPPPPASDIADWDFKAERGTYDIGDKVSFSGSYKYKGRAQKGQLTLSLGTGVYPSFSEKVKYPPASLDFEEAMDWAERSLTGTFPLTEVLKPGQTYSIRAKLETLEDKTQETDTDWGIITIAEVAPPPPPPPGEYTLTVLVVPLAAGWVTKDPDKPSYALGEVVELTAHEAPGYSFNYWEVQGEWAGSSYTLRLGMFANYNVKARFFAK